MYGQTFSRCFTFCMIYPFTRFDGYIIPSGYLPISISIYTYLYIIYISICMVCVVFRHIYSSPSYSCV